MDPLTAFEVAAGGQIPNRSKLGKFLANSPLTWLSTCQLISSPSSCLIFSLDSPAPPFHCSETLSPRLVIAACAQSNGFYIGDSTAIYSCGSVRHLQDEVRPQDLSLSEPLKSVQGLLGNEV